MNEQRLSDARQDQFDEKQICIEEEQEYLDNYIKPVAGDAAREKDNGSRARARKSRRITVATRAVSWLGNQLDYHAPQPTLHREQVIYLICVSPPL